MAFQTGTQVNPQLGALDFSGFTNAANIQGETLAQLGATIGGAITERREKKKKKELNSQAQKTIFGYLSKKPEVASIFGLDGDDLELEDTKAFVDVMGAAPSMKLIAQLEINDMKSGQTKSPTINDLTKLQEFLGTNNVIQGGRIVNLEGINETLPVTDDLVQQLLKTNVGRSQLYGYAPPTLISTDTEDEEE